MSSRFLLALILLLCPCPCYAADQATVVGFDLSLAGYRLGMSYDAVAQAGPFHFEQPVLVNSGEGEKFYVVIESVNVEGVAMNLRLSFKNDRVYKIVARILPESFKEVLLLFQQNLGAGEDMSKVFRTYDGKDVQLNIYRWKFPNADMHLVEDSCISDFATIGLVAK